ncbi:tetraacyldisaccharide 4'-kinase [Pedobacter arcticus]|uniref:tetraacyldisaccharide 4'-kinase n=1 Tax=Pedobacter arcticus TaxID=752140 RepID=UPI00030E25D2|nr:tetraacyldisaccharide 4'-kinase [Pedobacter arcticus]
MFQQFRKLLLPFSLLYGIVIFLRNKLYDWGLFKSRSFEIPIISVGNLEVGGSGKTPMVEYLIQLLKNNFKLSTLSRGYGRQTKGFRWVKPNQDATLTGDEPLQISRKFPEISVAVCENRVFGIQQIEKDHQLILMDDAYQHRAVKPGLSILLFDYHQIKKPRLLLPAGNYREAFSGRKRADILIVTKCPQTLAASAQEELEQVISPHQHQSLFFSSIKYAEELQSILNHTLIPTKSIHKDCTVLLLTGIAKPEPLLNEVKKLTKNIVHHSYPDHHQFSEKNMLKLVADFKNIKSDNKVIITTEKDAVRLKTDKFAPILNSLAIYQWQIEVDFLNDTKNEFNTLIKEYAQSN